MHCRPIRKATAKVACQAIYNDIITRFDCPKAVISDNGTQFTSRLFRNFFKELGIQHRTTPTYTPQANPVERTNKTTKTMVAQFCEANHKTWDVALPDLMFADNTARHDATRFSPALLNFGCELEVPKALYRDSEGGGTDSCTEPTNDDRAAHWDRLSKLRKVFELVRVNLARAFTKQSHYYNLRRREWRCHVGDRVYKSEHTLSSAGKGFAAVLGCKSNISGRIQFNSKRWEEDSTSSYQRFKIRFREPAYSSKCF